MKQGKTDRTDEVDLQANKLLPCLIDSLQDFFIKDIAVGNDHCLAISDGGKNLFSWGQGKYGALGTSKSQNEIEPRQIDLPPGIFIKEIAAGARHSGIITKNQSLLYLWGSAAHGQLGLGKECTDKCFKPELVDLGTGIKA